MEHVNDRVDRILAIAETIPPGRVLTYGDIAALVGSGGPRTVGRTMALYGGTVPWWRVIRADGRAPAGHEARALAHYRAEGTPLRAVDPPRIDLARARWDPGTGPGDDGSPAVPGDIPAELAAAIPPDRHHTPPTGTGTTGIPPGAPTR
ncbi:hypothetical protein GCM10027160_53230 [Streptomyces calidiresistens]|uniref:DNA-binding protein n=1 Tax=Streptomyces calidiresistens TaxID=1485586 RepID=A0A7W3XZ10_9ACTN|nr:MGMT family protein [Streptomyces calidiresistens]MBB0232760.1 DNA-binding protein [Streptomyces calidiresistens]